jgi:hypothetical protein
MGVLDKMGSNCFNVISVPELSFWHIFNQIGLDCLADIFKPDYQMKI